LNRFLIFFCSKYTLLKFQSLVKNDRPYQLNRCYSMFNGRGLVSINLSINAAFFFDLVSCGVGLERLFLRCHPCRCVLIAKPFLERMLFNLEKSNGVPMHSFSSVEFKSVFKSTEAHENAQRHRQLSLSRISINTQN
jgi:hypothetical protein